ncbi:MAG: FAD-dependent oxidoreductase [Clostridia bacterium]|nr:FAD-dependent oxidoreductase [Clostridia bacterium]
MHDVIVVGGGPAGMTAALYALRNGKSALVIEREGFGGQITHSPKVENYPGTLQMSGNEFAERLLDQILAQGAEIEFENVIKVEQNESTLTVRTEEGSAFEGKAVILATGASHRMLGLPGEQELVGEGVSYCAICDGDFYAGKDVCVVGGGNSALQEAVLLSDICRTVTILQDMPFLTGEQKLQDVLTKKENVRVMCGVAVTALNQSDGVLTGVGIRHRENSIEESVSCDGVFVAIGLVPHNEAFTDVADLDAAGYFDADERCLSMTPGVYVAGDCRRKGIRQLATAIADGACAAMAACRNMD